METLSSDAAAHPQDPPSEAPPSAVPPAVPTFGEDVNAAGAPQPADGGAVVAATGTPPVTGTRGRRRLWLALPAVGVVLLLAALVATLVDDVHSHSLAYTTQQKLTASQAQVGKLTGSEAADQATINDLNSAVAGLNAQLTAAPTLVVEGHSWTKPCDYNGCTMSATVTNSGSTGSGIVHFDITPSDQSTNVLAQCSVAVGPVTRGGAATVSCSADSAALQDYFNSHGASAKVIFSASVENT